MGKQPACSSDKNGEFKRGPWTAEEDKILIDYIQKHGHGKWRTLPTNAGLKRCGKSCRLRWANYLRPDIKRGKFSDEEEQTIIQLHSVLGNKWSAIASRLPGRTDNEIKNYWNTRIKKKLLKMGIDPITHNPALHLLHLSSLLTSFLSNSYNLNNHPNKFLLGTESMSDPNFLIPVLSSSQNKNQLQNIEKNQAGNTFFQCPDNNQYEQVNQFQECDSKGFFPMQSYGYYDCNLSMDDQNQTCFSGNISSLGSFGSG
ncbi:hypothetical protein E1A91_A08G028100v1 [Gossypium mustelinum]|uniref:Uncharacterized protein n=1 Tax=Gossypium mustelinum TaxID=34275 RepID=A0A5D2Y6U9_GOSMU|nr:hypothetical protein E1A91_A08G028100v1 [Gossypium mustelinum]